MDDLLIRSRLSMPVVTGTPSVSRPSPPGSGQQPAVPFRRVLEQQLSQQGGVSFSKHAVSRVEERNIELNENSLYRLNEGVRIAKEKGLDDTLIIVDRTAFIVSVKSGTVITTLGGNDLKGNAITNIEGTVII